MDTLGIVNGTHDLASAARRRGADSVAGCIDDLYQHAAYTEFTYNNTYGIQVINESEYRREKHELERPGGVLDMIRACQAAARTLDPDEHGDVEKVNALCLTAAQAGYELSFFPYFGEWKYGAYDVTHPGADAFPPNYWVGFLNRAWVQEALGVPVNHTSQSIMVNQAFTVTADFMKGGLVEDIAYVLDRGVKVALMYGDRDWYVILFRS